MRLGVAVHLTVELHVAAHLHCLIGREAGLQDRPVGGALCSGVGTKLAGLLVGLVWLVVEQGKDQREEVIQGVKNRQPHLGRPAGRCVRWSQTCSAPHRCSCPGRTARRFPLPDCPAAASPGEGKREGKRSGQGPRWGSTTERIRGGASVRLRSHRTQQFVAQQD